MRWKKRPEKPTNNAYTEAQLIDRLKRGPLNTHHPLPQSRWDKKSVNETVELNTYLHTVLWHGQLHNNMIAREVAQQWTIWWQKGYIFLGNKRKGKFNCGYTAPGTFDEPWRRPEIKLTMTPDQIEAWDKLFGLYTDPHVVEKIGNRFFFHPESPVQLVPSWSFWNR